MQIRQPAVYILANKRNGTLYIGVTSQLAKRVYLHKHKMLKGFTSKYNITILVYYESSGCMYDAITRECQLKNWKRAWKLKLIEDFNPHWKDLYTDII